MRVTTLKFEDETIKGHVTLEVMPGRDRLRALKDINLTPSGDGTISFNSNTLDSIIKGTEILEKLVKEVNLVVGEDNVLSFEDLEYSNVFNTVIMRLITVIINGPERLGK